MNKIIYFSLALILFIAACKKDLITYQGKPDVYFNAAAKLPVYQGEPLLDSSVVSFSFIKASDSIQQIVVAISGAPSNADRSYKMTVDPSSTAVAGTHYDVLPANFTIRKNQIKDTVAIKFHRTPEMQTNTYSLILNLEQNENFVANMKDKVINAATGKKLSFIKHRIFIDDIVRKPKYWLDSYFGVFSRKKLFLITEVLNVTAGYIDTKISVAELVAFGQFMQRYLNEQKSAGKTIYEEDGTEMIMGPGAQ